MAIDVTEKVADHKTAAAATAATAAAAALTPLAVKGLGKLAGAVSSNGAGDVIAAPKRAVQDATSGVGEKVSGAVKKALPFGGDDDDDGDSGVRGVGKGRRMPVQQSIDVAVPIETAYNQWTQFEEWPQFMHRVTRVSQEDRTTVSFATKIWGKTKEFKAKIVTQRPDEKIKWEVTEGMTHTGWVTFHEIAPQLTRVELSLDVEPGGMLEKAARGLRHVKRAARGDLHRFKAYIEAREEETGAWRGTIEDGKVKRGRQSRGQSQNGSSGRSRSSSRSSSGRARTRGH